MRSFPLLFALGACAMQCDNASPQSKKLEKLSDHPEIIEVCQTNAVIGLQTLLQDQVHLAWEGAEEDGIEEHMAEFTALGQDAMLKAMGSCVTFRIGDYFVCDGEICVPSKMRISNADESTIDVSDVTVVLDDPNKEIHPYIIKQCAFLANRTVDLIMGGENTSFKKRFPQVAEKDPGSFNMGVAAAMFAAEDATRACYGIHTGFQFECSLSGPTEISCGPKNLTKPTP